jgi:hypothetical protein
MSQTTILFAASAALLLLLAAAFLLLGLDAGTAEETAGFMRSRSFLV